MTLEQDLPADAAWTVPLGAAIGAAMFGLSLAGLLGRLSGASVAIAVVFAVSLGIACARGLRVPRPAGLLLTLLPLLLPLALAAILLPPYAWDDVAYGAALPRDFAAAGRFFYKADYGAYAAFPANYEALVTASLLLTGEVSAAQALNVVCALALAAIAVSLARTLGAPRTIALLAGVFVLCGPVLARTAPLTKNDTANALFHVLAVFALLVFGDGPGYRAALFSGAFLGLSLGIKYSSLHFALAAGPFMILFLARSGASSAARVKRVLAWAAAFGLCAAPWYARNALAFGNPIFPFFNETLGAHNSFTPLHSDMLREAFDGMSNFSLRTGSPQTFVTGLVRGLGLVPVLLLLPGVVFTLASPRRPVAILVAGITVAYSSLTFFAGYWEPRYFLSLLVFASALATVPLRRLYSAWPGQRSRLGRALPVALLVAGASSALPGAIPAWREQYRNVALRLRDGSDAFARSEAPHYELAEWLNAHLRAHDRVAIGFNLQPFYYLHRSYYHIHPLTEGRLIAATTPDEVEAALRDVGATVWAFSMAAGTSFEGMPKISAYLENLRRAHRELRRSGRLRHLATVGGVKVYRLEPPPAPPGAPSADGPPTGAVDP